MALTKRVVSAMPFHCATAPVTKLLPVKVSENAGPPAVVEAGDRDANVGAGFGALIVNVSGLEVAPGIGGVLP